MDASVIVPVVVAIIMALPGIYAAFFQAKKSESEVADAAQKAALAIINPLREEVAALRARVSEQDKIIDELRELNKKKDNRIEELERTVAERDDKIQCMEIEINELRKRVDEVERHRPKTTPIKRG